MENREYLNNLFDIYKDLLTKIEQETFIDYYMEDLSLTEIAENRNITKSSVSKTLKQVTNKLIFYEEKLKIYNKEINLKELLNLNNITTIKETLKNILNN